MPVPSEEYDSLTFDFVRFYGIVQFLNLSLSSAFLFILLYPSIISTNNAVKSTFHDRSFFLNFETDIN